MPDVMTVCGPVAADRLGVTLIHEHLLFDGDWHHAALTDPERAAIGETPLRIETLGFARKYGYEHLDNSHRLDVDEAIEEVGHFRAAGGATVVDVTPIGLGRDPRALRRISEATGLHIVMGSGYYIHERHPPELDERTVEDIADELVCDLTVGVDGTGIRSGIIGEIGMTRVTPREEKVLRAAARAQAATGAPLSIHHDIYERTAPRLLEIAREEGADMARTILCHMDQDARCEPEYFAAVAETGASIALDTFGHYDFYAYSRHPQWHASPRRVFPTDWDRAEMIAALAAAGYLDRVVVAQDVCLKIQLKRWGGFGFDHILESCVPMWRRIGLTDGDIRRILVDNPARVLAGNGVA
jgi:phosphotriesterase-related protein